MKRKRRKSTYRSAMELIKSEPENIHYDWLADAIAFHEDDES